LAAGGSSWRRPLPPEEPFKAMTPALIAASPRSSRPPCDGPGYAEARAAWEVRAADDVLLRKVAWVRKHRGAKRSPRSFLQVAY